MTASSSESPEAASSIVRLDLEEAPSSHFDVADEARLAALKRYQSVYSPPEEAFDRLTRLAADLFDAPVAYINFIGRDRQWTKSCVSEECPPEVGFDLSFCVHNVQEEGPMVIEDARNDERFADNPVVTGEMPITESGEGVCFYAGVPLTTSDGYRIGSICVMDTEPRAPDPGRIRQLADLAAIAVDELELRAGYRYHEDILESITDAFFAVDDNWTFTYVNGKAEKWLQRDRDELIGTNIWEAFPGAVDLAFYERYKTVRDQNRSVQFEAYFPPLDSWFRVHAYPFREGLSVYFSDVTERKQYEQALQEAKQAAEDANASKSRFVAGVAHDLQTPLSVINMQSELLRNEAGGAASEYVENIQSATEQLQSMATSLMDLAKLQNDSPPMQTEACDVRSVLGAAVSAIELYAEREHVTLYSNVPPRPLRAVVHAESLRRVVDNLVTNAISYSEAEDTVAVYAAPSHEPPQAYPGHARKETHEGGEKDALQRTGQVRITVSDNGPGIPPELLEDLFEPYVRGDRGSGSGLGLTVAKELIEAMDGDIVVRSEEGEGTAFYVFVPAAIVPSE
ncbi:ATP-binding protein [Longimonas halophila]|nr:ATP-binding protein [Longimonas halophila]